MGAHTLTLYSVNWSGGAQETVDYTRIANTFTAHAVYTRQGTRNITLGYVTTAEFRGELSRVNEGETTYSAMFIGTPAEVAPDNNYGYDEQGNLIVGHDDDGRPIIGHDGEGNPILAYGYSDDVSRQPREPIQINWPVFFSVIGMLGLAGAAAWFFLLRGNVEVFNLHTDADGKTKFVKIGRANVSRSRTIVDLSPFTNKAQSSAYELVIAGWVANRLDGRTVTVNCGSSTLQHEVAYAKGMKKYKIEVEV